ncbi:DUF3592 domain-containing protein [Arthrobacter sp. Y81]|uniref:DUF3592 domain-containing protein n=1 Tax=Arthrobacter sp. Y81 TaxID=2058897 RepID=UPI000CE340D0|nr:DUF3592 domain-containing protein [Arthrobacter sp. Y81]
MTIEPYLIWALFVGGATYSFVRVVRKARRHERLTAGWPRVRAIVTGSVAGWSNGAGGTSNRRRYFPTYQFADSHGTLFAGESEVSSAGQPVPGTFVEVTYNPLNPNQSFQVSSQNRIAIGCLMAFFAVFAVVSFVFITLFGRG